MQTFKNGNRRNLVADLNDAIEEELVTLLASGGALLMKELGERSHEQHYEPDFGVRELVQ